MRLEKMRNWNGEFEMANMENVYREKANTEKANMKRANMG